jgi:hypothetical protein
LVLEQAADDVKQFISKWYTPHAPAIFSEDNRRRMYHNNLVNSNQKPLGAQCYIPCYTLIHIACQKLANEEPTPMISVGGKAVHGIERGQTVEDFLSKSLIPPPTPSTNSTAQVAEIEEGEEDEIPEPTPDVSKEIDEMYRPPPQGQGYQRGYPRQGQGPPGFSRPQGNESQGQQALNMQLQHAQNKLAQMKHLVQNQDHVQGQIAQLNQAMNQVAANKLTHEENQPLALNVEKVLVEKPPFQSSRFQELPVDTEKVALGYHVDITPKDEKGEPIRTIPFCYLCTAADAHLLDTSELDIETAFQAAVQLINGKT